MAMTFPSRVLWAAFSIYLFLLPTDSALRAESDRASFECRWADGEITIDGKADEAAWSKAQVIENFSLPWLGQAARQLAEQPSSPFCVLTFVFCNLTWILARRSVRLVA